jgi:hypothetical protein
VEDLGEGVEGWGGGWVVFGEGEEELVEFLFVDGFGGEGVVVDNVLVEIDFFDGGYMDMFGDGVDLFGDEG